MTAVALHPPVARASRGRSLLPLVFDEGGPTSRRCWMAILTLGLVAHSAVFLAAGRLKRPAPELPAMEVLLTPVPPPRALPPPPAPDAEPDPPPPKSPAAPAARPARDPGVQARAGRVLAASSEAAGTSSDPIVTGEAETYAGGSTASTGTSGEAVEPSPAPPPPPPPPPPPKIDVVALTRAYLGRVREALARERHYPLAAQRTGIEGTVIVAFTIDASGAFTRATVASSSGSDLLDQAALDTVNALSRKIPRPKEIGAPELPLRTALRFEIAR